MWWSGGWGSRCVAAAVVVAAAAAEGRTSRCASIPTLSAALAGICTGIASALKPRPQLRSCLHCLHQDNTICGCTAATLRTVQSRLPLFQLLSPQKNSTGGTAARHHAHPKSMAKLWWHMKFTTCTCFRWPAWPCMRTVRAEGRACCASYAAWSRSNSRIASCNSTAAAGGSRRKAHGGARRLIEPVLCRMSLLLQ